MMSEHPNHIKIIFKKILGFLSLLWFFIIIYIINYVEPNANAKLKIDKIREEYKGEIIRKYSVRDTEPTHVEIKLKSSVISRSPNQEIVRLAEIGDSIIKPKNENFVFLIRESDIVVKLFYTKLSNETRKNKNFPKEWRNKWLESTE